MPPREKSPESLNSQKRLYSDNRGRGSRTTRTSRTSRTPILTTRSARLRRQLNINDLELGPVILFLSVIKYDEIISFVDKHIQLKSELMARLLNKLYVNKVNLSGQNPPLKCC